MTLDRGRRRTISGLAAGAVSVALKLGIGKRLGIAAVRTVIQLGLLGLILERVFALDDPALVVLLIGFTLAYLINKNFKGSPFWTTVIVLPMMLICLAKMSRRSVWTSGPLVLPTHTIRPPRAR